MTHHLGLCSKRIRMRADLIQKNYRTLVILFCTESIEGLSETLEDLFFSMGKNADLIILSNFNVIPHEGVKHPPFELINALKVESLERYVGDYSHLVVLKAGDRVKDFAFEQLLFHLELDKECLGIYSDYFRGDILHPLPDWDPVLIQFENYVAAPVLFEFSSLVKLLKNARETLPKILNASMDWDRLLDRVLKDLPPRSLGHLPEALFTLSAPPNSFPTSSKVQKKSFSLSVIIPTNGKKLSVLKKCVQSLLTVTAYGSPVEIILLDNSRGVGQGLYYEYLNALPDKGVKVSPYDLPFNWSAINNFGASLASGEILLFLNDDTEVTSPTWMADLLVPFNFPWVGVVSPRLVYPDGTIQHAGATLLPYGGGAANIGLGATTLPDSLWNRNPRSVSTVMGACLATRHELFQRLGGFDERYRIVLSETAYCLSVGKAGYRIVYNPHATVIHHERMSRKGVDPPEDEALFWKDWGAKIMAPDPYYPAIYEKNPESVRFELSDRKKAITVLESPFLYPDEMRNILILRSGGRENERILGDVVGKVRSNFPSAKIFLACEPREVKTLESAGYADQVLEIDRFFDRGEQSGSFSGIRTLRANLPGFDIAIDLGDHPKTQEALETTSHAVFTITPAPSQSGESVTPVLTRCGQFSSDSRFGRLHYTTQESGLFGAIPMMTLPRSIFRPQKTSPISIGINTGSCSEEKRWPIGHFEQLTRILLRLGFDVILFGEAEDVFWNSSIQKRVGKEYAGTVLDLTGKIGLSDYKNTVEENCVLYIGNNSDVTHLVASTGMSTIAIFGGIVDPFERFPVGENVTVIFRDVSCAPCYSNTCLFNRECFNEVLPEDILSLIWKDLKKAPGL